MNGGDPASFDTARMAGELEELDRLAARFGATMVRSLGQATASGRSLGDVLRGLALSLSSQALSAGLAPLSRLAGSALGGGGAGGGAGGSDLLGSLAGGAMSLLSGLTGGSGGAAGVSPAVTVNIATPDLDSFRQSQSQVAASLARGVSRGMRNL
jgi:hypothetical protein